MNSINRYFANMWTSLRVWFPNSRRIWLGIFFVMVLIAFVVFAPHSNWTQDNYDETVRRGNEIVAALEAYQKRHKEYPVELEDLRPDYLKEILPPVVGNGRWQYSKIVGNGKGGFNLFAGEYLIENDPETAPIMWYSPDTKKWPVDTR